MVFNVINSCWYWICHTFGCCFEYFISAFKHTQTHNMLSFLLSFFHSCPFPFRPIASARSSFSDMETDWNAFKYDEIKNSSRSVCCVHCAMWYTYILSIKIPMSLRFQVFCVRFFVYISWKKGCIETPFFFSRLTDNVHAFSCSGWSMFFCFLLKSCISLVVESIAFSWAHKRITFVDKIKEKAIVVLLLEFAHANARTIPFIHKASMAGARVAIFAAYSLDVVDMRCKLHTKHTHGTSHTTHTLQTKT